MMTRSGTPILTSLSSSMTLKLRKNLLVMIQDAKSPFLTRTSQELSDFRILKLQFNVELKKLILQFLDKMDLMELSTVSFPQNSYLK